MKYRYLVLVVLTGGIFSQSSFAISEAYRAQLEKSGCTQVSEANGTCNTKHSLKQKSHANTEEAHELARDIESNIAGKYQGQAVDYMYAEGWHQMNQESTRWSKDGYIAEFDMVSSGKVMGIVIR